jgi:MFS family permease
VVLTGCLLAFGIGGGLGALAPSFALLVAARLVQGAGAAGLINLVVAIIADAWDGAERTRRIGRNSAALAVAMVALPPIGGALAAIAGGGWRSSRTGPASPSRLRCGGGCPRPPTRPGLQACCEPPLG